MSVAWADFIDAANRNAAAISLLFSAVVMTATVAYVILTWRLVRETRESRMAAGAAKIGVYLQPQARWVGFLDLVIENHGSGAARDLEWEIAADADGLRKRGVTALDAAMFKGFSYMAPGQRVVMFFGQGPRLLTEPVPDPIEIKVQYVHENGERGESAFSIDLSEWKELRQLGTPPDEKMAKALDDIASTLREKLR